MTTWVTPRTWATDEDITAARLNTIRDNLSWLKGFADLITGGTAADEGTETGLEIMGEDGGALIEALRTGVVENDHPEFKLALDGNMSWGDGSSPSGDASFGREEARVLALFDTQWRSYRVVNTDPAFSARVTGESFARTSIHAGFIDMLEGSVPAAPDTGRFRLYAVDNGGKTEIRARFDDGSSIQIGIQP